MISRSTETTPDDSTEPGVIAPEVAEKYGRALSTVQKSWMVAPEWPAPTGRRGRWNEYDAAAVDKAVRAKFLRESPNQEGEPDDLLTIAQIADYTGLARSTIAADITRDRFAEPDDTARDTKRWKRSTVDEVMSTRRRYKRDAE